MRTNVNDRTAELQRKFPAIRSALSRLNENGVDASKDSVYISIERVDLDILSNTPVLCSGVGASLREPTQPGLLGWQHDVFFAVNEDHQILGHIGTLSAREKRDETPVKHLVLTHRYELCYLVRLTVTGWCHRTTEWKDDSPLGELARRDVIVTVYREPDEGFDGLLARTWTDENLRIHFRSIFGGSFANNPDVQYFLKRLGPIVKEFSEKTFFNGFREIVPLHSMRENATGRIGEVSYDAEAWTDSPTSRKIRVTFQKGDVFLRFWYAQNSGEYVSIDGMDATLDEARQLVAEINMGWMRRLIGEDTLNRIQDLWTSAVEVTSRTYGFRLSDANVILEAAIPGVSITRQVGNLYLIEVPAESEEAFQALQSSGVLEDPTEEETAQLTDGMTPVVRND